MVIHVKRIFLVALVGVIVDQVIKNVLCISMNMGESVSIIDGFFSLTLIGNTGAAFSLFSSGTILLIIVSIVVLNVIYFWLIKDKNLNLFEEITYGLLMGGITGNLIDRVWHMQVIDYLDFNLFGYNFPVFNLADMLIVISLFMIVIYTLKGDKNENSGKRRKRSA